LDFGFWILDFGFWILDCNYSAFVLVRSNTPCSRFSPREARAEIAILNLMEAIAEICPTATSLTKIRPCCFCVPAPHLKSTQFITYSSLLKIAVSARAKRGLSCYPNSKQPNRKLHGAIQNPKSKIQNLTPKIYPMLFHRPFVRHYGILSLVLLVGLGLRFWQLDSKPLWLDEVLTALFTMGRRFEDVPLNQFFPLSALQSLFMLQPQVSCAQIAQTIATESVHPPLFFCAMHQWLWFLDRWGLGQNWTWAMRSLPALIGVGAIAASYLLGRIAFSARVGLVSAALMAVSPFAVYLSQEARHYTLPMLIITLALTALVLIQRELLQRSRSHLSANSIPNLILWLCWILLNGVGLYVHYFFILAFAAQVMAVVIALFTVRYKSLYGWVALGLAIAAVLSIWLPWLPTVLGHFARPETDWLIPYQPNWLDRIAPIYQTLVGWVLMAIALPTESQPRWMRTLSGALMLSFALWLLPHLLRGAKQVWNNIAQRPSLLLIASFTLTVLLEFAFIVYGLDKDITVVPRYNFVYYPALALLFALALTARNAVQTSKFLLPTLLLIGLLSSALTVNGLVFQKSYRPDRVARNLAQDQTQPTLVIVTYESLQEVALGLSFGLALQQRYGSTDGDRLVRYSFFDRSRGYGQVWRSLRQTPPPLPLPLNLWVIGTPGMRSENYPDRLRLGAKRQGVVCGIDPEQFRRDGFPYQMYRCLKQG
jgi:uncharacterized membrane protein